MSTRRVKSRPNVLFVFADQWRAQSAGYAGNPDVHTPHIDGLAKRSINCVNAISGCPVCSPYRASLLTGQYPLTHGVFINDTSLDPDAVTVGKCFRNAGYATAYIGKWHVDGHGRTAFIPGERRQGFDYWKVCECTHDYNHSLYYGDTDEQRYWRGYDAAAQTDDAIAWLGTRRGVSDPFCLFLSWGPPHSPYGSAPERFRAPYDPASLMLPPNVPPPHTADARTSLAGYYAHISALDSCMGALLASLRDLGFEENTLVVLTSDHGDMLGAFGTWDKQQPHEESVRVPFLLRWPGMPGWSPRIVHSLIDSPDIMPTLLSLCDIRVPDTVEGRSLAGVLEGTEADDIDEALLLCPMPFGNWHRGVGGKEYRGVRTMRYTYTRDLRGPWLLYDNIADPWHQHNLCGTSEHAEAQSNLDSALRRLLVKRGDQFLAGEEHCRAWGYVTDERGIVVERMQRDGDGGSIPRT
ncbi:MAG: sulfatase-like hydrolase/transferase [Chitinivibrionales bacterium]|nr:sulfatase-like hydrolase/transferase [Chitinivibrionales bacterium]